ncbi:MAG: Asp-tRNA(Asn)/Glu-tRNA(Gln) amidotransferase subunit GatB, partial [Phycisphaeraceae bacterium]
KWDRKSYYYPDLPKNYQISQYDLPLCYEGVMEVPVTDEPGAELKPIRITRAHLEEDAGKLMHEGAGGKKIDYSIVDLNRAGTPLLEIVTEPDFETADHAVMFGQSLRNICRFMGVSEGIMQRGHMRFEPNINVIIEKDGQEYATPIVEIKNLNSFRALYAAIQYEHQRQVEQWLDDGKTLESGGKSTRGWDDVRLVTLLQREKEAAQDYRYFPDPDLVPVTLKKDYIDRLHSELPELPLQRESRYIHEFKLNSKDARALVDEREVCFFFESVVEAGVPAKRAAAILLNNLGKRANERGIFLSALGITPAQIAAIERMNADNKISSSAADELYGLCIELGPAADAEKLAEEKGLMQVSDDTAIDAWVDAAIAAEPQAADDVANGKMAAVGRLIGAAMKAS